MYLADCANVMPATFFKLVAGKLPENKPSDRVDIGLLGAYAVMLVANASPDLVKQFGSRGNRFEDRIYGIHGMCPLFTVIYSRMNVLYIAVNQM